jgi:uridine nucleosidase
MMLLLLLFCLLLLPPSALLQALVELLLTFFATTYRDVFKFHDGAPLHDPCAVAAIIAPSIFKVGGRA